MHFEARIAPLDGKLPKVSYRWDPETDILTVACKGVPKGNGMNGTVDLEGGDGSFVVIDVAGGALRGVDVVTWPDDVRTVATLAPPETSKEGQVTFPDRRSQPGVAAVEVDTALTVDKNQTESVFHIRVGQKRPITVVRVATVRTSSGHVTTSTPRSAPPATSMTTNEPSPPSRSTVPFMPFPFGTPLQATVRMSVSGSQRYDTFGSLPSSGAMRASKCMSG